VFSQGETLQELEENIEEAYRLMVEAEAPSPRPVVQETLCELIRRQLGLR
jgi:predicted RNase H-like HicB family nuclease